MRYNRTMRSASGLFRTVVVFGLVGCAGGKPRPVTPVEEPKVDVPAPWLDPETFAPRGLPRATAALADAARNPNAPTIAIVGGTILTAAGQRIERGTLIAKGGAITYVGDGSVAIPADAIRVDASGRFVTPGLIDAHSHLGVYPAPNARAHGDGNEATAPVTSQVRAEWAYWPGDPQIPRALAGGTTTALILPGSANLVGGRGFTAVMKLGRTPAEVAFPGAPPTLKMACGENPKRVYGEKGGPSTRMGVYAQFRVAFQEAAAYAGKRVAYAAARALWEKKRDQAAELSAKHGKPLSGETGPEPPAIDLRLETLAAVLRGEILVQVHCYRASDIAQMLQIADEMGFRIRSFHHALEAYKVRDLLVARDIAINTWSDWWGFKLEAFDGIPENAALFTEQGGRATIHSDSPIQTQVLNQDAAKAMAAGRRAGIAVTEEDALRWITANPAWVLGIDAVTGTLEVGKRADVVIWSGSPFSIYSHADQVLVAGEVAYDRAKGLTPSDFELGQTTIDRSAP